VALTSPNDEPIFFSLNGGPWQSYAGPMTFDGYLGGYLSLQAIYTGGATNFFAYTFQADPPVATPESQILDSGPITLSVANGNTIGAAVVYFEGDAGGGVASTNRPMVAYTDPITVPASRSYLFQARKNNYLPSALVGRTFTSQLPAPTVLTSAGTFTAPVQVQVQSGLPGYGGPYLMINPDGTTNKVTTEAPLVTQHASHRQRRNQSQTAEDLLQPGRDCSDNQLGDLLATDPDQRRRHHHLAGHARWLQSDAPDQHVCLRSGREHQPRSHFLHERHELYAHTARPE
jgi:hypothetical protein